MIMLWVGLMIIGLMYFSVMARRADLRRKLPSSLTRPLSTWTPRNILPSPWSHQPIQSAYFHGCRTHARREEGC